MKLSALVLSALVGSVAGFGGASEWDKESACHDCVCSADPGTLEDPSDKNCCKVDTWDTFCDAVAQDRTLKCYTKCLGHKAHEAKTDTPPAKLGQFCGEMSYYTRPCEKGLHCHLDDPFDQVGYCDLLHTVISQAVTQGANDFEYESFKALGVEMVDVREHNHTDGDIHFDIKFDGSADTEKLLAEISSILGVSQEDLKLTLDANTPSRRQYNPYYPSYGTVTVSNQQTSYPSSTGSSSSADSTYNLMTKNGIQLLAFDWDLTACTHHTFKESYASYDQLVALMSKDFVALANKWCYDGKPVAIVTYNDATLYVGGRGVKGPDMIKEVLRRTFANNPKCANMPIYARNDHNKGTGKQWHLGMAQKNAGVSAAQTVLIDDTKNNIDIAKRYNQPNMWVNPASGFKYSNTAYFWTPSYSG